MKWVYDSSNYILIFVNQLNILVCHSILPFTAIADFLSVVNLSDFPLLPRLVRLPDRLFLLRLSIVWVCDSETEK